MLSLKKDRFELNFYYPCFICNSPFDKNQEAMIILNSSVQMKNTSFEHFYSIFTYRNPYQKEYRTIDFEIMGNNYDLWGEQFKNDLENLFTNQSLQLIGGYNCPDSNNEFKFVMYETVENYNNSKFDLDVDTLFGHVTAELLETYLNNKYSKEMYVFMSVFTISKCSNSKQIQDDFNQIMHLIVFQDMKVNYEDYDQSFRFVYLILIECINYIFNIINCIRFEIQIIENAYSRIFAFEFSTRLRSHIKKFRK